MNMALSTALRASGATILVILDFFIPDPWRQHFENFRCASGLFAALYLIYLPKLVLRAKTGLQCVLTFALLNYIFAPRTRSSILILNMVTT